MRPRPQAGLVAIAMLLALPATAVADWLVTQDGARIETKGPWQVKGRQVVFTLPNGTLSAMRVSEVDLDASTAATQAANNPAPAAASQAPRAEPARDPVLVLTNKNVAAAAIPPAAEEGGGASEAQAQPRPRPPGSAAVDVVTWESRDSQDVDGLEIVGTLRNSGVEIATNINVSVTVVDQERAPLYETTAFLRSSGLAPGRSTTFRALLPGIYTLFEDPIFDVQSGAITVQGPSDPAGQQADGDLDGDVDDFQVFDDDGSGNGGAGSSSSGGGVSGGIEESRPPGVIEGVEAGPVYESPEPQEPQGDGGGGRG